MADQELSYAERRMQTLRVTDTNNRIELENPEAEFPSPKVTEVPIFGKDQKGNLLIKYWTVDGQLRHYLPPNTSKNGQQRAKIYTRKRLAEPKGDFKYNAPKGEPAWPWYPPLVTNAYREAQEVKVLYLTEGPLKSWYASLQGIHCIGLASTTCYRIGETGELYPGIVKFIERCKVETVVILWDADCRDISMKALARQEELTKRPGSFFYATKQIQRLLRSAKFTKSRQQVNVVAMHPNRGILDEDPKGIDDVLMAAEAESDEKLQAVVSDLKQASRKGPFFFRMEITSGCNRLLRHYKLQRNDPEPFYEHHSQEIGENQYSYYGDIYQYIDGADELELVAPSWADNVIWVGDEFFQISQTPSADKDRTRLKLLKRTKETLKRVYRKDFQKYLPYYTSFVNIPSHFNYQRTVHLGNERFFNRYFPFEHVAETGAIDNTIMFIKHIFGEIDVTHPVTGHKVKRYEMGLDYIQQLLVNPAQKLPVVILYSPENNTGKSIFCKLLSHIFRNNIVPLSNSDLQSDFNAIMADKLAVYCEETMLDRKIYTERIKNLSTASEITMNEKNVAQVTIDFFTKFIFCSNNKRMIYLNAKDERFWILQVPKPKVKDVHLLEKMIAEIPAFIHFLQHRDMATADEGRMWFNEELLRTENFYQTVEVNEPAEVSDLRYALGELFIKGGPDLQEIEMPMSCIFEEFFKGKNPSKKWIRELLTDYLGVEQRKNATGQTVVTNGKYKRYKMAHNGNELIEIMEEVHWQGRPYVFYRKDFLDDDSLDSSSLQDMSERKAA